MSMISLLPLPEGSDFRHLQASFNKSKPRTTLTVETTIILPICDKFCQNLYKSVPIFMSFASFQVYFHRFHFDLTFFIFTPLSVRRGVGGEVKKHKDILNFCHFYLLRPTATSSYQRRIFSSFSLSFTISSTYSATQFKLFSTSSFVNLTILIL